MNKNLDVKLKNFQVKRLKKWLRLPHYKQRQTCPFDGLTYLNSHLICEKVFPDMNPSLSFKTCPCNAYGLNSAIKAAKELIRRNTK